MASQLPARSKVSSWHRIVSLIFCSFLFPVVEDPAQERSVHSTSSSSDRPTHRWNLNRRGWEECQAHLQWGLDICCLSVYFEEVDNILLRTWLAYGRQDIKCQDSPIFSFFLNLVITCVSQEGAQNRARWCICLCFSLSLGCNTGLSLFKINLSFSSFLVFLIFLLFLPNSFNIY